MKLNEFNKLNLQPDQRVKISWTPAFENKTVSAILYVKGIKETVLGPNNKELCLYFMNTSFLRVSRIDSIEILPEIERKSFMVYWEDNSGSELIKGETFIQALKYYGIDRKDVGRWEKVSA